MVDPFVACKAPFETTPVLFVVAAAVAPSRTSVAPLTRAVIATYDVVEADQRTGKMPAPTAPAVKGKPVIVRALAVRVLPDVFSRSVRSKKTIRPIRV